MKKIERKYLNYKWKNYIYELDFLASENKIWLAFLWDFKKFNNKKDLETYFSIEAPKIVEEYLKEWGESKAESFLPFDDEERLEMQKNTDYFEKNMQKIIQKIEKYKKSKKDRKSMISIRLNWDSLQIIKQYAKDNNIPYQTLINMQIDTLAEDISVWKKIKSLN